MADQTAALPEGVQKVSPEFMELTQEIDRVGDQIDAHKAELKRLRPEYKAILDRATVYMRDKNIPRCDTATGRSNIGVVKQTTQKSISKDMIMHSISRVFPASTEEERQVVWNEINAQRAKEQTFTIRRSLNAPAE